MPSEKTPLVGGEHGFYFFNKKTSSLQRDNSLEGTAGEGDAAEPLVVREKEPVETSAAPAEATQWGTEQGGGGSSRGWWPFGPKPKPQDVANKARAASIKVEPKVFFSNERTFIAWMNMAVTLATIATAIIAFAERNPWTELYGLILLPVTIGFVVYALFQYMRRARLIRHRAPGPYEDRTGPAVLAILLMVSIMLNCGLKLYEMYT